MVPPPAAPTTLRVDWRRTVGGVEVVGSAVDPRSDHLEMLDRALDELPAALMETSGLERVRLVDAGSGEEGASAVGAEVRLPPEAFSTTFDLVRALAHELTHTAQNAAGGDLVAEFARSFGWDGSAAAAVDGTTAYGRTGPEEDMAESVAETVAGPEPAVSAGRRAWVATWLDVPAAALAGTRPWVPAGAVRAQPSRPLYDVDEVARRAGGSAVETVSWTLPPSSPSLENLGHRIRAVLSDRGVVGALAPVPDPAVASLVGWFRRPDGVRYRVEVWDPRRAPGLGEPPPTPVVTYVVVWP